ncbi:MAG: amidohydrolase family protein [Bacteroidota bacterium]
MIDLLIHASHIYPLGGTYRSCNAIAIKHGRVVATGDISVLRQQYKARKQLELGEAYIYPAFHDAHCHLHRYARQQLEVDLRGCRSETEMLERVKSFAEQNPEGWIVGRSWDQNLWERPVYPSRERLDQYFPDRPVYLERIDIHAALVNTVALNLAGITESSSVPGGEIKTKEGRMTGILIDNARNPLIDLIPAPSEERWEYALNRAQKSLWSMGLVALGDAMLTGEEADRLVRLEQKGSFVMPVYGMIPADEAHLKRYLAAGPQQQANVSLGAFKLFADGALGSRGAWLMEDYSDAPGERGLQLLDFDETLAIAQKVYDAGFQLCIHAIGDAANRQVIELYQKILPPGNQRRWRIEHCQMMAREDFRIMQQYNILPSIQPTHAISDAPWVGQRIGDRMMKSYPAQTLLDACGKIVYGTDFPVESPDPLATFRASVLREVEGEVFLSEERLSAQKTLSAMTEWAAFSAFWEAERGSLQAGKWADMIILDRNLLGERPEDVRFTKLLQTWVAGKVVF